MMSIIVGAALALLSAAILVYPFLKSRFGARRAVTSDLSTSAAPEVEPIYDAISTLQLEYDLGKVPEHLYQEQLRGYRLQAAATLRQRVEERAGTPEWLLEQEVMVARAALHRPGAGTSCGNNTNTNSESTSGPRACPNCRSLVATGLASCPECGANLSPRP